MKTSLYNQDGTLSAQAQSLLSPKPDDMSIGESRKILKVFKAQLSEEDLKEFNRLKKKAVDNIWYIKNQERIKRQSSNWKKRNPEKATEHDRKYGAKRRAQKPEEIRKYIALYYKTRRQKDPLFKFLCNVRVQASRVIKQIGIGKKPADTFELIGCSPKELKSYIESLFQEGMTWENHGRHGWHIDHIRPVSSFKPEELNQINHYTNLQPLWWQDNLSKSDKW